jgi:hypothetical protein
VRCLLALRPPAYELDQLQPRRFRRPQLQYKPSVPRTTARAEYSSLGNLRAFEHFRATRASFADERFCGSLTDQFPLDRELNGASLLKEGGTDLNVNPIIPSPNSILLNQQYLFEKSGRRSVTTIKLSVATCCVAKRMRTACDYCESRALLDCKSAEGGA